MIFRRLFIALFLIILTQNLIGETKVNISTEEKRFNHQIKKIFNSGEYHLYRSENIKELKNLDKFLTSRHLRVARLIFFDSLVQEGDDIGKINFTPDMLNDENKINFETAFSYIDRKDLLDKLDVVNILIRRLKKVDNSTTFGSLINERYGVTHNVDMAIHWLAYFLSKPEVDVNCYKKNSLMRSVISKNNYDAAKLVMKHGYKATDFDFEVLRNQIQMVSEDTEDFYYKDKALKALSKIETLLMDNINNKAPEPPPSRGFFD